MALREYQLDLKKALRASLAIHKYILAILPTGGGKTYTFSDIVKDAWNKGSKVCILTDRVELLTQAGGALKDFGLQPLHIEAGKNPNLKGSLYVSMSETLKRRASKDEYKEFIESVDLWIIDEAHKRSFSKLFPLMSDKARVIGFTATPVRIGQKDQLGDTYTDIVVGVEIKYLVENKFLAKPIYYGVKADLDGVKMKRGDYNQDEIAERFSATKLYAGVYENWMQNTPDTKTIIFSSNIANSLELVEEFKSHGKECKHLDSKMSKTERGNVLRWFKNNPKGILSNVGILTTGFDEPTIETVILYRATTSLSLYLQMVGRGSRFIEGLKETFNLLDFGNNIVTHGFWHEARSWDLSVKKAKKNKGEAVLKNCDNCDAFISASTVKCPECGHEDVKEKKKQEVAKLQLLDPKELRSQAAAGTLKDKAELCQLKLVKASWVFHQLRTYKEVKEFVHLMEYSDSWLATNHHRYWFSRDYLAEVNGTDLQEVSNTTGGFSGLISGRG